jgi:hypothetical protein
MFLVKTSYFFLLSSLYSLLKLRYVISLLLACLFTTSCIHHSNGAHPENKIAIYDKVLAHIITFMCIYYTVIYKIVSSFLCVLYVGGVYYFIIKKDQVYQPGELYLWHGSIHFVSSLGVYFTVNYLNN